MIEGLGLPRDPKVIAQVATLIVEREALNLEDPEYQ